MVINWRVLQMAKGNFRYTIWFMNYPYILTKGRSFKTFLKDNYGINCFRHRQLLYFYYKNVEHEMEHDVDDSACIVFAYIKRCRTLQ